MFYTSTTLIIHLANIYFHFLSIVKLNDTVKWDMKGIKISFLYFYLDTSFIVPNKNVIMKSMGCDLLQNKQFQLTCSTVLSWILITYFELYSGLSTTFKTINSS